MERREAKELFCYLFLGKFQIKYMIGEGNKDKRGEKVEAIKIKDILICNTCKICICLNKYACWGKKRNKIQKANFIFWEGLKLWGRLSREPENKNFLA